MLRNDVRRTAKVLCLFMAVLLVMGMLPISAAATTDTIAIVTNAAEPVTETATETESNGWSRFWNLCWIVIAIAFTAIISNYRAYKREQKLLDSYNASSASLLRENKALKNLKKATSLELSNAQTRIDSLESWRNRAISCYPKIEELVQSSYAKDIADIFFKKYYFLESAHPTYENYSKFESALADYYQLSDNVKLQLTINIQLLKQKRAEALANYIETAKSRLMQTDTNIVGTTRDDFLVLSRVIEWYENMPEAIRAEIPSATITSLKMKKANAEYNLEIMDNAPNSLVATENNGGIINKFVDSLVAKASKLFGKASEWIVEKVHESKKYLNDPFENSYYDDDEFDEDDDDNAHDDGDTSSNNKTDATSNDSCTSGDSSDTAANVSEDENVPQNVHILEPGETYTL